MMTMLMRTAVALVSVVMCWADGVEGQQNAYCESICTLSPACANATHGTYCTYWAEAPLCYGLFSLDGDICYHPDAECPDYDPIPCDTNAISNSTTPLPSTPTNNTMASPSSCQFTVLCVDGSLAGNCTLQSTPSPSCPCQGFNFTCGNGTDLCPESTANFTDVFNATSCNVTDCLASCTSISNSSINGTQYVCNCSTGNSSYPYINVTETTILPDGTTSPPVTTVSSTASPTSAPLSPSSTASLTSAPASPSSTASPTSAVVNLTTVTASPTPTTTSSSPPELPYGTYCGLLGDDLPLVFSFSEESVDIAGGEVFSLVDIGFFGLDPNSPAGKTLDINLSDPQFSTITGPNGSLDRQFLALSYYSSTDSLGGFFTGRPVELSPNDC